jgi:glycosyltransferase involved in cell wall biosynthesis
MKNLDGALRILGKVREPIELHIFGPIEDNRYWEECKAEIARLPANVSVKYIGSLAPHDVHVTLSQYDLFFLPTHGENFGHVVVEALCAGCPVLLSTATPWRMLEASNVGWDIPLSDDAAFADRIEYLSRLSREQRHAMRVAAKAYGMHIVNESTTIEHNRLVLQTAAGLVTPSAGNE